ncbi:Dynamin-related protein 4C [Sesamum alatum]|uniref:Dynamin-related protein 4C n=1 Tax=Sesamum alatum TaxID=300844 RepID=A0AAE1YRZ5_9LAMI|nr:Dynamin-related protein 4C [Sesamum alatum]
MEKLSDYTCNPEYIDSWNKLMVHQNILMETLNDHSKPTKIQIEGLGDVDVAHLRNHVGVVQEAFDLRMRLTAYWKIVLRRLVDSMALHLLFSLQNLVNKEMETEIINELIGPQGNGLERMLEESPVVAENGRGSRTASSCSRNPRMSFPTSWTELELMWTDYD